MRDNWNELIIGEEINFLGGFPFSSSKFNDEGVGKPLIRIRDLLGSKQETFFSGEFSESYLIKEGDVLIGMDGDFHIVKWNNSPSLLNQRILKVSGKQNGKIDIDFLYYYLMPFLLEVHKKTAATTVKHLSTFDVSLASDHFPPLPQQRKIAKILSTCDTVIAKTEEAIAKYQAIKQGMMHDLFTRGIDLSTGKLRLKYQDAPEFYKESELGMIPKGWEVKRLEEVADYVDHRGKTPPKSDKGIFLITAKNIKFGYIDYEISKEFIPANAYELTMSRGKPKIGDVLITTEAPMGNVAQIDNDIFALAQRVIKYRCKENVMTNDFLTHSLMSEYFQKELVAESTGSTVMGIKGSRLHKLVVGQPTIDEQNKICSMAKPLQDKIEKEQLSLFKYQQIKSGLMQDLLSGKVEVQVSEPLINAD